MKLDKKEIEIISTFLKNKIALISAMIQSIELDIRDYNAREGTGIIKESDCDIFHWHDSIRSHKRSISFLESLLKNLHDCP